MKVTLVYPPWQFYSPSKLYPMGVGYLAAQLISAGFENIDIIDLNHEISDTQDVFKKALDLVEKRAPDILGITCWTVHLPFCLEFVALYKKKHPGVKIILGGVHASSQPEEMMKLCPADIIVRGEGEETLVDLIRAIEKKRDLSEVPGISYRQRGIVHHTKERPLVKNLDDLPFPAYHLLAPIEQYQPLNRSCVFSILASRGCSYRCIFCSANRQWKYQRRRSAENIIAEINFFIDRYGLGFVRFEDDDLTMKREWAMQLFTLLKGVPVRFDCLTRIDKVDNGLLQVMAEAGCEGIYHGVESASARLRKLLRKGFPDWMTNEYVKNMITREVALGLTPTVSAMIGIPTETEEEVKETFELMCDLKRLGAKTQLWMMTPYPDTEAVTLYRDHLIRIDRWKELRQFDVFSQVPREAYSNLIKKYDSLIPDNWMFKNAIDDLARMKELYLNGASKILGELEFV
jgi:anaerobic magnesium-protoporphyrin IX monomethyl ester cyclase